jgi:hypothetical protein
VIPIAVSLSQAPQPCNASCAVQADWADLLPEANDPAKIDVQSVSREHHTGQQVTIGEALAPGKTFRAAADP